MAYETDHTYTLTTAGCKPGEVYNTSGYTALFCDVLIGNECIHTYYTLRESSLINNFRVGCYAGCHIGNKHSERIASGYRVLGRDALISKDKVNSRGKR